MTLTTNTTQMAFLFCSILLSYGCATYHEMEDVAALDADILTGYQERKISEGKFWLIYTGLSNDDPETLKGFWFKRADELCGPKNYSASPSQKAGGSYVKGTLYLEGEVACMDMEIAEHNSPKNYIYNPKGVKYVIKSVTTQSSEIDSNTAVRLRNALNAALQQNSLQPEGHAPASAEIIVVVQRYRLRTGLANEMLGFLSGKDYIESNVKVARIGSSESLKEKEIKTSIISQFSDEYALRERHTKDIIAFLSGSGASNEK